MVPGAGDAGPAQVVLLVLDGLGEEQLRERRALAPMLSSGVGGPITSVAPSTTACALTSPRDRAGCRPNTASSATGWPSTATCMNVLQWSLRGADARMSVPAPTFQPFESFPGARGPVPVVTRARLRTDRVHRRAPGSTWTCTAGTRRRGSSPRSAQLTAAGAPFVYAYYEGIDKVAHAQGLGPYYDDELRAVDRLVGDVLEALPPGAVLVVTADHGQVEVGSSVEVLGPEIMEAVTLISGEGRFRWLHARPGATG